MWGIGRPSSIYVDLSDTRTFDLLCSQGCGKVLISKETVLRTRSHAKVPPKNSHKKCVKNKHATMKSGKKRMRKAATTRTRMNQIQTTKNEQLQKQQRFEALRALHSLLQGHNLKRREVNVFEVMCFLDEAERNRIEFGIAMDVSSILSLQIRLASISETYSERLVR